MADRLTHENALENTVISDGVWVNSFRASLKMFTVDGLVGYFQLFQLVEFRWRFL